MFVTGKGGVGKTTVAAALGLAAVRAGKRTMVCEVAEQQRLTALFGRESAGARETEVWPGLHTFSVSPAAAREEWLRDQLRSGTLAGLVNSSRIFSYLAAAAPGLAELVTVGKIWELAQLERRRSGDAPYDLVIVDAPATGHGVALMRAPRTFGDIARVGPIARQAGIIDGFLRDPALTAVIAVALAEEMPVNETIALAASLREEMGHELGATLVNSVLPERLSAADRNALGGGLTDLSSVAGAAVRAVLADHARAHAQHAQVARLRRALRGRVATLPHLLVPEIGTGELDVLARELEHKL